MTCLRSLPRYAFSGRIPVYVCFVFLFSLLLPGVACMLVFVVWFPSIKEGSLAMVYRLGREEGILSF
jgi:hypothetical protein